MSAKARAARRRKRAIRRGGHASRRAAWLWLGPGPDPALTVRRAIQSQTREVRP